MTVVPQIAPLICPSCGKPIAAALTASRPRSATGFDECLRRCEDCGIGVSNAANPASVTFIHKDPLGNIPAECRAGAAEALNQALNVRNRFSKYQKFGFSTSEDAVSWVVFSYLLRVGLLPTALGQAGVGIGQIAGTPPTVLLWGVPINNHESGMEIRNSLSGLCRRLGEDENAFSEPDVIVDLGQDGLVFIEVKHRSGNDRKPMDYRGWPKYLAADLGWNVEEVQASGCYELARNWRLMRGLAGERPACLVNLGPASLFRGTEGARLDRFSVALRTDQRSRFERVSWPAFLGPARKNAPDWFARFCCSRGLTE